METTKNKISEETIQFLNNLSNYLDTKFIYYGSVQRNDYLPQKSDIDVAIFTDNEYSIMSKMKTYLHISGRKFKKVIWRLHNKKRSIVYGYKIKYENPEKDLVVEFTIYNEKFKSDLVEEYQKKFTLPFYCSIMLYIIKILFYNLHIIPGKLYSYLKRKILSLSVGTPDDEFIILPEPI
jgi:predicted nucleotidyltransferase